MRMGFLGLGSSSKDMEGVKQNGDDGSCFWTCKPCKKSTDFDVEIFGYEHRGG